MLLRKWRASSDRSPWGNFWFEPVAAHSASGLRVGNDQALRLAAVYACVQLLAKTFAVLPFGLFTPKAGGGRTAVTDHWLYQLLGKRPNPWQNPFEFRQMLQGHLALRGNAYCQIIDGRAGAINALVPLHPDRMRLELLGDSGEYRYRYRLPSGTDQIFPRGEIWHLRGLMTNGYVGLNPIEAQRDSVGLGLAAQEYGSRFFANDATPPGWLEHPGKFADKAARDVFRESLQNAQTGANRGKTMVLEGGMKYHEIVVKNSDAQYLESRRFTVSEIARIFGVPPHLIGDLDRATFSNIEQQSLEFVIYTMTPIVEAWEASIEFSLLPDDEGLETEFDLARLLRGDQASRSTFYSQMFQIGALSTNDVRIREGENPVEGGDMRFRPANLSPLDPKDAQQLAAMVVPPSTAPADPEGTSEDSEARLAKLAADRILRKELAALENAEPGDVRAFYERHAAWVASVLGIPFSAAAAYCAAQVADVGRNLLPENFAALTQGRLERLAKKGSL